MITLVLQSAMRSCCWYRYPFSSGLCSQVTPQMLLTDSSEGGHSCQPPLKYFSIISPLGCMLLKILLQSNKILVDLFMVDSLM